MMLMMMAALTYRIAEISASLAEYHACSLVLPAWSISLTPIHIYRDKEIV